MSNPKDAPTKVERNPHDGLIETENTAQQAQGGELVLDDQSIETVREDEPDAPGLLAQVHDASHKALLAGDHADHAALHHVEIALGAVLQRISEGERITQGETLSLLLKVKAAL